MCSLVVCMVDGLGGVVCTSGLDCSDSIKLWLKRTGVSLRWR
jgi:hypothetical protein